VQHRAVRPSTPHLAENRLEPFRSLAHFGRALRWA
jgi:hypothetical protein